MHQGAEEASGIKSQVDAAPTSSSSSKGAEQPDTAFKHWPHCKWPGCQQLWFMRVYSALLAAVVRRAVCCLAFLLQQVLHVSARQQELPSMS
jgi:hypothetical protein